MAGAVDSKEVKTNTRGDEGCERGDCIGEDKIAAVILVQVAGSGECYRDVILVCPARVVSYCSHIRATRGISR